MFACFARGASEERPRRARRLPEAADPTNGYSINSSNNSYSINSSNNSYSINSSNNSYSINSSNNSYSINSSSNSHSRLRSVSIISIFEISI